MIILMIVGNKFVYCRFREMAEEVERKYDMRPKRDIKKDSRYRAVCKILNRSH